MNRRIFLRFGLTAIPTCLIGFSAKLPRKPLTQYTVITADGPISAMLHKDVPLLGSPLGIGNYVATRKAAIKRFGNRWIVEIQYEERC